MPCSDHYDGPSDLEMRNHRAMTRLSCDRCREIEARGGTVPDWAQEWWQAHQKRDAERLMHERKVQKESEIRKQAIAKLTPAERAELGV